MAPDDLGDQVVDQLEAAADLGVLVVVAQLDQREHLAGDVAVLAPAGHLVVAQLGTRLAKAGALAFSLNWHFQRWAATAPIGPPP